MKDKLKKLPKIFLKYSCVYLIMIILFFSLMVVSYLLPNNRIRENVAESLPVLEQEGNGYSPFYKEAASTMDTHTESLILNIAMNKGMSDNNLKNAVENSFYEDQTQGGLSSLQESIAKEEINNHEYSRYWHGIQTILRPLLMFFDYAQIRFIITAVILILLTIVVAMIAKQLKIIYAVAFALTMSFIYIAIVSVSLQYSPILIVTLLGMITVLLLYKYEKEKYLGYLFFIIGGFATYFDLLTYPLITLGLPLVLAVLFENKKEKKLLEQVLNVIKLCVLWAIGYALIFVSKWVIASIILNKDAVSLALEQILFRVNGSETYPTTRLGALETNIVYFYTPIITKILITISIIWAILFIIFRKKEIKNYKVIIPLICTAIIPYLWYIVFSGHSQIHSWFTNRIQAITVFAILCAMIETVDIKRIKIGKNKKQSQ